MRLNEIPIAKVLEGTTWVVTYNEGEDRDNPLVREAENFSSGDVGLFSAIMKMNDGSEHACVIVKDFSDGGLHTDTFVLTKSGWLNIFADGFPRAAGRYQHDIFPFELFIGKPWKGDQELAQEGPDKIREHVEHFAKSVERLKTSAQM